MFDCSNSYNLIIFNIYKKLERFIYIIATYVIINNKELNLNTFIERDNDN